MKTLEKEVLEVIRSDARLTAKQIAATLGASEADVKACIDDLENTGAIVKYTAIVNGEKVFTAKKLCKVSAPAKEFTVGYVNGGYLNGVLDDFGVFAAPLSKEEAKKIFDSKVPLSQLFAK